MFHSRSVKSPPLCITRCQSYAKRGIPSAVSVVLIIRMERFTASRIHGPVLKQMPQSSSFILGIKSKSQGVKTRRYDGWQSTSLHRLCCMHPIIVLQINEWVLQRVEPLLSHKASFRLCSKNEY
ncbi:hypothetical protein TNCV_4594141 [Trichonephila clavipes]|uniref:Uncharacterized protein n=1 Tax=Trichonephila clavipes TaxID=2585209 RepID=A0A8X6WFP2_TRICX|nr:hypothetical protein TNCV_4594141 [Trichonephila clavipes]